MKNQQFQLLVAEDDPKLCHTLKAFLTANGYDVLIAQDGQQALELYYQNSRTIDLLLLDVMMPLLDGFEVLAQVREKSEDLPIIMLTARESETDQLRGLGLGADNYLTKPFLLRVLKAHIDAQLRRTGKRNHQVLVQGGLSIQPEFRVVELNGTPLELTPKEYDVLLFFVSNTRRVLTRNQILDAVWGLDFDGDIRTVDTIVKQLRKKLTSACPYIRSVYGVGYQFQVTDTTHGH